MIDEFLTLGQVMKMLPFRASYQWIENRELAGEFPKGERVSPRKILYRREEIEEYIARRRSRKDDHVASPSPKKEKPSHKRPERVAKPKRRATRS